jgi:DUF438 domain-containing protein
MTLEQINLMLTHLPVDLTFVDENDRVALMGVMELHVYRKKGST